MTTPSMRLLAAKAPAAAGGFEPTEIAGCVGWWDASDTGSITASGNDCTQMADKSGGGYHFTQGSAGKYPQTGTATINSLNVLSFDGSADAMSAASFAGLNAATGMTVFYVIESAATGDRVLLEMSANYNSTTGFLAFQTSTGRYLSMGQSNGGVSINQARTSTISGSTPYVVAWAANRAASNPENSFWLNGTPDTTTTATGDTSGAYGTQTLYLGARGVTLLYWSGKLGELVIYDSVLGTSDREAVEDYLGPKWGVTIA